jgi:hypothetical protein
MAALLGATNIAQLLKARGDRAPRLNACFITGCCKRSDPFGDEKIGTVLVLLQHLLRARPQFAFRYHVAA